MTLLFAEGLADNLRFRFQTSMTAKVADINARFTGIPQITKPQAYFISETEIAASVNAASAVFVLVEGATLEQRKWRINTHADFEYRVRIGTFQTAQDVEAARRLTFRMMLALFEILNEEGADEFEPYRLGGGPVEFDFSPVYATDSSTRVAEASFLITMHGRETFA